MKSNIGLLVLLGAIAAFFSGIIFLVALLVVQPFEMALTPKRMWMHDVSIVWVVTSVGCCAVFGGIFALLNRHQPNLGNARKGRPLTSTSTIDAREHQGDDTAEVWVCYYGASPLARRIEIEHQTEQDLDTLKRYQKGETLEPSDLPANFIYRDGKTPLDIMMCGFIFVSDDVKRILLEFDLGRDKFAALDSFKKSASNLDFDRRFSILTLENRKTAFSAEESDPSAIRQVAKAIPMWALYIADFPDGSIAVMENALEGPDIWRDPTAPNYIFCSGRVKAALDEQGIGKKMGLKQCRVAGHTS